MYDYRRENFTNRLRYCRVFPSVKYRGGLGAADSPLRFSAFFGLKSVEARPRNFEAGSTSSLISSTCSEISTIDCCSDVGTPWIS
jgi:hypothetical protein